MGPGDEEFRGSVPIKIPNKRPLMEIERIVGKEYRGDLQNGLEGLGVPCRRVFSNIDPISGEKDQFWNGIAIKIPNIEKDLMMVNSECLRRTIRK